MTSYLLCWRLALWGALPVSAAIAVSAPARSPCGREPCAEVALIGTLRSGIREGTAALAEAEGAIERTWAGARVANHLPRRGRRAKVAQVRPPEVGLGSPLASEGPAQLANEVGAHGDGLSALGASLRSRVGARAHASGSPHRGAQPAPRESAAEAPEELKDSGNTSIGESAEEDKEGVVEEDEKEEASLELLVDQVYGHSLVTPEEAWRRMRHSSRHSRDPEKTKHSSPNKFRNSAEIFEWILFFAAVPLFVVLHYYLIDWPSSRQYHGFALFIWLLVGLCYALVIRFRLGVEASHAWAAGYLLEFIFSMENVFVFHIIVSAFKTPRKQVQKALFIVVCCQCAFQMIFYMGLAHWLRSLRVLPYVLGTWLLYIGVESTGGHSEEVDVTETRSYWIFAWLLGDHLRPEYEPTGALVASHDGKRHVTLLGVTAACLLAVDFFLEVDVTLTKIEELDNEYLAFTSSVTAGFAMPELFFIARDLFRRYRLLQYGVSFALLLFGAEMVCQKLVVVPELVSCASIFAVMAVLVALSAFTSIGESTPLSPGRARASSGLWG